MSQNPAPLRLIDPRPIADALPSIENDPDLWRRSSSPAFAVGGCRGNCQQGRRACTCHSLTLADIEQAERDRDLPIPPPHIWPQVPGGASDRYHDPDRRAKHEEAPAPDERAAAQPPTRGTLRKAIDGAFWRGFGCGFVVFVMVLLSLIAAGVLTQWAEDHSLIHRPSHQPRPVEPARPMTHLAGPPVLAAA